MNAIAGLLRWDADIDPGRGCARIVEALRRYGPHGSSHWADDSVALGRALYFLLPEDAYDTQPLVGGAGRFRLVADIRIDNRNELSRELGVAEREDAAWSDAATLLACWEKWGEAALERIAGDFAFALWDKAHQRLTLARDALGQRPLHYHAGKGFFAFASMPRALHALEAVPRAINAARLAEAACDMPLAGPDSFYESICRLEPGHVLTVDRGRVVTRRHWEPPISELRLRSTADYVEAFREQLDRATAARLRRAVGAAAAQLSGGYDSSSVAATAARLMAPETLLALTSVPREGFTGEVPRGRVADESPYAGMTASLYPNIDHVLVRAGGGSALAMLDKSHQLFQHPVAQVSNNLWWSAINDEAQRRGAAVMLTGQAGNLTISAAGVELLADYVRTGQWLDWWREARKLVARGPARWRGVLAGSFGPWLPRPIWTRIHQSFVGGSARANTPYLLHLDWTARIDNSVRIGRDSRPVRNSYATRLQILQSIDPGNFRKGVLAGWGIDERDPTADRRLVEFCFSLPHEQLLKDGVTRPLARAALADRLPPLILDGAPRGYQAAGWYEAVPKDEMLRNIALAEQDPLASSVLNTRRMRQMVRDWPARDWNSPRVVEEYRLGLLAALSAAHFARTGLGSRE